MAYLARENAHITTRPDLDRFGWSIKTDDVDLWMRRPMVVKRTDLQIVIPEIEHALTESNGGSVRRQQGQPSCLVVHVHRPVRQHEILDPHNMV